MEADWEVEFGGDSAVIDPLWTGFIDLRLEPDRVNEISETRDFPPLGAALLRLNTENSPVWTAKCDFWLQLEPETWDPDEMEADASDALNATGCYIDLLARNPARWKSPEQAEHDCRTLCQRFRIIHLNRCRTDLIVRKAWFDGNLGSHGITAYITACGPSPQAAAAQLAESLAVWADAVLKLPSCPAQAGNSTVQ
ncbi:MAG: hypothetical protein P4L03_09065 [Terracidiphilus sp.]|nr:hypothetical protein [Terracidiphilus sp.]